MKTLKFHFIFCALAALSVLASCTNDDDNDGQKQTYTCHVKIETTMVGDFDDVYQAAVAAEKTEIQNAFASALSTDTLGEFTYQATDTTALKAEVAAKCEAASANLGSSWKACHQMSVWQEVDEKNSRKLYSKTFGTASGANDSDGCYNMQRIYMGSNGKWDVETYRFESCYKNEFRDLAIADDNAVKEKVIDGCWYKYCNDLDLNYLAHGWAYVFLWATDEGGKEPITFVICVKSDNYLDGNFKLQFENNTYEMVNSYDGCSLDLNYHTGGPYLYLMVTRDYRDGYTLRNFKTQNTNTARAYATYEEGILSYQDGSAMVTLSSRVQKVPMVDVNGKKLNDFADMNAGAGGNYIYLHARYCAPR